MKNLFIAGLVVLSVAVTACGGKSEKEKRADFLVARLNALAPGLNVEVAKFKTQQGGKWIVISASGGTQTIAVNLDVITTGMTDAQLTAAFAVAGTNEVVTQIGASNNYLGTVSGNVYEETAVTSKDLEKAAAVVEAMDINNLSQALSANYGLSEERSYEVAKLAKSWNKLAKTRAMTAADADALSTDMAGFDMSEAQAAYERAQAGDASAMNALIERAAGHNGVSPEQMSRIVSEVIAL